MNLGSGNVSVSFQEREAEVTLTVIPAVLDELTITCINQGTTLPAGTTRQCKLEGIFSDGSTQVLTTDPDVSWDTSQISIASVDSSGLITGGSSGLTQIGASYHGLDTSLNVVVSSATLTSIDITPANGSFALGATQQFTAIGTYSDQTIQDLTTQVSWASLNTGVATISNMIGSKGFLSTQAAGSATITANLGAVNGQTQVTVTSAVLVGISITPANPTVALGRNLNLTATGLFSDGTVSNITHQTT